MSNIDNTINNPHVLWEIRFKSPETENSQTIGAHVLSDKKPEIDIYVPPFSKEKMLHFNAAEIIEIQALDYLGRIKKLCDKLQEEVQKQNSATNNYQKNATIINKAMDNLGEVIKRFNDILQRFKNPKKPEDPN